MHDPVRTFLESVSEAFPLRGPIYEFGYRPGVDPAGGPMPQGRSCEQGYLGGAPAEPAEIERLEDLVRLPFPDGAARTVLAVNALEHVYEPRRAGEEMIRILAPGGILILCSQPGARSAQSPERYWQPTPWAIQRLLACLEATLIGWQGAGDSPHTLFGIASRSPVAGTFIAGVNRFLDGFQTRLDEAASQSRWWPRLKRRFASWLRERNGASDLRDRPTPGRGNRTAESRQRPPFPATPGFYKAQFVLHLPVPKQFKHRLLASCLPEEDRGTRLDTSR